MLNDFYQWNFGVTSTESDTSNLFSPQYTYTDTGHYNVTLIATNNLGCIDTVKQVIWVKPDYVFFAPNAFTPNGDGHNDHFTIFYIHRFEGQELGVHDAPAF